MANEIEEFDPANGHHHHCPDRATCACAAQLYVLADKFETENRRLRKFMSLRVGPEEPRMTELDRYEGIEVQQMIGRFLRGPQPFWPSRDRP